MLVWFFLFSFLFLALVMHLLWIRQNQNQNATDVDLGWVFGLGLIGASVSLLFGEFPRSIFVGGLVFLWSLRLGFFILFTRLKKENKEDGRYAKLRQIWGDKAKRNFWFVYQVQALLATLFGVPIAVAATNSSSFPQATDFTAVAIGLTAILGERTADRQLARWRADPGNRGKTCQAGLWRYSRHPNYFFEWLHWWAYVAFAWGSEYWLYSLSGPILMALFLLKITGIPATEKQALLTRPDYADYQRRTSAFFPWFPKSG